MTASGKSGTKAKLTDKNTKLMSGKSSKLTIMRLEKLSRHPFRFHIKPEYL